MIRFDVPVTPDRDTAEQWATEELSKAIYHRGPTLLERFMSWLNSEVQEVLAHTSANTSGAIVISIIAIIAIVTAIVAGPVRRARAIRTQIDPKLLIDDTRSAAQIRAAAESAAQEKNWRLATAEWYRAIVRDFEERTILDERPGWTADEAAMAAGVRLPGLADRLKRGALRFDEIVYGDRDADRNDETTMRELALTAHKTRPVQKAALI